MQSPALRAAGNAHLLPIDRNYPTLVLYLPLWYPHGDMTGSTIYSYDKNRHVGTVTEATWGYQGRTFDGSNDELSIAAHASYNDLALTSNLTVMAWVKPTALSISTILSTYIVSTGFTLVTLNTGAISAYFDGIARNSAGVYLANGTWAQIGFTYKGASDKKVYFYVNGVYKEVSTAIAAFTANAQAATISDTRGGFSRLNGTVGEVLLYNRILSDGEIMRIYQQTKWRYK